MKIVRDKRIARSAQGFTLIELMIVVVIVAILAAIAVPSYRAHVVKANRADAMAVLQSFAQAMERYYAQNNTYDGAAAGTVFPAQSPIEGAARYTLSIEAADASTYTLRATPVTGGTQVDDGYLEITNTGLRSWNRNNDSDVNDANEHSWSTH